VFVYDRVGWNTMNSLAAPRLPAPVRTEPGKPRIAFYVLPHGRRGGIVTSLDMPRARFDTLALSLFDPIGQVIDALNAFQPDRPRRLLQWLPVLPLTPTGKLDRLALPPVEPAESDTGHVAPRIPIEVELARIWAEVLGVERPGIHDDFFDVGGDSLSAMRIGARIRDTLGLDLPQRSFFECPTIAGLAEVLLGLAVEGRPARARTDRRDQ
jgi:acyl carrier protein